MRRIIYTLALAMLSIGSMSSQIAIGTKTLADGAIFQLESADKGLMLPRLTLDSRDDTDCIKGTETESMLVYNSTSNGLGKMKVTPGFYFWDHNDEWKRMYNEGYTVQFEQTAGIRSPDNSTTVTLPGLDQTITAPYSGTYEIHASGYIACAAMIDTNYEAVVTGSLKLEMDNVEVAESFVMSTSKKYPGGTFRVLGQQATIVYHVDLEAGQSYNFKVRGRQWQHVNVQSGSISYLISGNYAFWGVHTNTFGGNDLGIENAQDGYLTITLLRQF